MLPPVECVHATRRSAHGRHVDLVERGVAREIKRYLVERGVAAICYRQLTARTLYEKLLCTAADISLTPDLCTVSLKKKRDLPALLEALQTVGTTRIPWLGNRQVVFNGASRS